MFIDTNDDIEQKHNEKSLIRDTAALLNPELIKKQKKTDGNLVDYLNKFDKMKKKYQGQTFKKFTDSDEEVLEEAETYKNRIDVEIADDLKEKRKVVLKEIEKLKIYKEKMAEKSKEDEEVGGLIIKKKLDEDNNSYFDEIITNIGNDFDMNNYSHLNTIINKKQDDKNKKRIDKNIDYSVGGLQTFLNQNQTEVNPEIKHTEEEKDLDFTDENDMFQKKKRERYIEVNSNSMVRKKVYGVTPKPVSRNQVQNDEEYDYDATFITQEQFSKGYDLTSKEKKYKKADDD